MTRSRILRIVAVGLASLTTVLLYNRFGPQPDDNGDDLGVPTYAVSGRAAYRDGQVPAGLRIRLRGLEDGRVRSVSVPVQPDGTFVAKGLRPGVYTATALIAGSGEGAPDTEAGSREVTIENVDVSGIVIDLRRRD